MKTMCIDILIIENENFYGHLQRVHDVIGSYGLGLAILKDGNSISFAAYDIPTSANTIHQYTVDWNALSQGEEGVIVRIDADGDKTFEKIISYSNELTHDEFILKTSETDVLPPSNEIPEFPTLALPVIALIGLMFLFQRRRVNR